MASILENYSGEMFEINYDKHIKMNRKILEFLYNDNRAPGYILNQIQNGKIQTLETYTLEAPVTEIYEAIKQTWENILMKTQIVRCWFRWKNFGKINS